MLSPSMEERTNSFLLPVQTSSVEQENSLSFRQHIVEIKIPRAEGRNTTGILHFSNKTS